MFIYYGVEAHKAVKEPWRRSSRFEAMGQMLLTNQRLDKLAASRIDFASRGMLKGTCLSEMLYKFGAHQRCCLISISVLINLHVQD